MGIVVSSLNRKHKINDIFIAKIANKILRAIKKSGKDIEIVFLSDKAIRPINKNYKGRDRATDVLSFELGQQGLILISSDTAFKNSRTFDTSFEKELTLYVIHGILHLFNYNDEKPAQKLRMFKKQESILEMLCEKTDLSKALMRR